MKTTGRLRYSSSAYLRQHSGQPVDWWPWSKAAIDRARQENKLILISSGYASCHWCHVMAGESFSDLEIAGELNADYIAVKLDREQHPDLDGALMAYVQAATGFGGWPLNVILTPDMQPVAGATYLPPRDSETRRGFLTLVKQVASLWKQDRAALVEAGNKARMVLQGFYGPVAARALPARRALAEGVHAYQRDFDGANGGFGRGPKFPMPASLRFLAFAARAWPLPVVSGEEPSPEAVRRLADARLAARMLHVTLGAIVNGGVHDQIGGGFHRYAVDAEWRLPHFEKNLADQALMLDALVDGVQEARASGIRLVEAEEYARVARRVVGFLERSLRTGNGMFAASLDADSRQGGESGTRAAEEGEWGEEGAYYVWSAGEIERVLGGAECPAIWIPLAVVAYGIELAGNIAPEHDPAGRFRSLNVLRVARSVAELAGRFGLTEEEVREALEGVRQKLLAARNNRPAPALDGKLLVEWNAYAAAALVRAARVLGNPEWVELAAGALKPVLEARASLGYLPHDLSNAPNDGGDPGAIASPVALAADYAAVIAACIELHSAYAEATDWLDWAVRLQGDLDGQWWSDEHGAYVTARVDRNALLTAASLEDVVTPSPTSLAAIYLPKLEQLTGDKAYGRRQIKIMQAFGARVLPVNPASRKAGEVAVAIRPEQTPYGLVAAHIWYEGTSTLSWTGIPEGKLWELALAHDRMDVAFRRGDASGAASAVLCNKYGCAILEA